jgi:serine kinase of HPr protein (carbohydrate metabolism regulator)
MSETVHGTAVLAGTHGVLIRGASGSGKSMLAFALMERGARLIADDRVHLSACHGRIVASAVAPIAGFFELRGRGIVAVPHERSGVIGLVVDIVSDEALERMPEDDQMMTALLGVALPRQPVPAALERAMMLVEAALGALLPQCNTGLRTARVWR